MSDGPGAWVALAAVAVLLVFWMLGAYNRLVGLRGAIGAAWRKVDDALAVRGAALAALVTALRVPLAGEGAALDALVTAQAHVSAAADALRANPVLGGSAVAAVRAEAGMGAATARVLALVEQQPVLRDDPAVAAPAATLRETAPRLVFARQVFNGAVAAYNDAARQFPTRLLTRLYGFGTAGRL
ncbi:MAG: LemA family protein [Rubrivivax sp.]